MEPIWTLRQLIQSAGQFVVVFLMMVRPIGFKNLSMETIWEPLIEATLGALVLLGFSRVGPAPANVEIKVEKKP
jgi:hypothetical protein